jgi:hypothetical protein
MSDKCKVGVYELARASVLSYILHEEVDCMFGLERAFYELHGF